MKQIEGLSPLRLALYRLLAVALLVFLVYGSLPIVRAAIEQVVVKL